MKSAFIIVDVQNDFCIGGKLEVKNANEIFPLVNKINLEYSNKFKLRIVTQDWHPEDHISFIGNNLESKLVDPSEITLKWKVILIICKILSNFF
jgi:nicotinamidase/pyrazinamidase